MEDSDAVVVLLSVTMGQRRCARHDYGHDGGCHGEEGQATLNGNGAKHTIFGLPETPKSGWLAVLCTTVVGLDVAFWSTIGLQTASHDCSSKCTQLLRGYGAPPTSGRRARGM